jgi:hypothetical protein
MSTTTIQVNFESLRARGPSAATVIKLMMACNDLSVVNQALGEWKDRSARSDKTIRPGGGMYFIRAEIAHLYEALTIIGQIRDDTSLMAVVESCDQQTRDSFGKLLPYLSGGTSHDEFQQLIGLVRHNLTFHYDASGKLTQRAVADRAARADGRWSSVTRGSNARLWHFQVADDVVDSIVVRQIWQVPLGTDAREGADVVVVRVHAVFQVFMDFAGEFIWKYCRR